MRKQRLQRTVLAMSIALGALVCIGSAAATPEVGGPVANAAKTACDRDCLIAFADRYMDEAVRHDLKAVPFAAGAKITENARLVQPGENVFSDTKYIKYPRQYVADPKTGQIGVEGVLDDWAGEAIFALRVKVVDQKITEVEILVSHDGEGGVAFEPAGFLLRQAPYIDEIPAPVHTPRAELLDIAKNFWDVATTTHDRSKVAFSSDCMHIENGMNTDWEHRRLGPAFQSDAFAAQADGRHFLCATDLATSTMPWSTLRDYRAIADEQRGLVMIWNMVDFKASAGGPFPATNDVTLAAELFAKINRAQGFGLNDIPSGLSIRGMAAASPSHTNYNVEVARIIDGKIQRQQDFVHILPVDAPSPWSH